MPQKLTLSVIKADIGGWVGHCSVHPEICELAEERLEEAKGAGVILDGLRGRVGDDTALIMTHRRGIDASDIHEFAWDTFVAMTEKARELGQYGAGQDLLADSFSGNVRGMGPGCAEMEIEVRPSEPIIVFLADKTEPGAWNLPLYKMFADPFNTAGLVIDPNMHGGFVFEVHDLFEEKKVSFDAPDEIYDLLVYVGAPARYVIKHVFRKSDGEIAAATSTQRLSLIAGRYVGKDDPVMIVRCQSGLPAVGEALEPFAFPHTVAGWMRGSHHGPLMPVSWDDDTPSRFDGPPRVVAYGLQLLEDGRLGRPHDMLGDISFDNSRALALDVADYMRRHGPFEPHRLSLDEMEYTTMPMVEERLRDRFQPIE